MISGHVSCSASPSLHTAAEIDTLNMFLFQFVGFVQVNNLKQTLNRLVFTVHRFSIILIIILKFLGSCYVDSL